MKRYVIFNYYTYCFPKALKKAIFKNTYTCAKQAFEDSSITQTGAWLGKLLANGTNIVPTGTEVPQLHQAHHDPGRKYRICLFHPVPVNRHLQYNSSQAVLFVIPAKQKARVSLLNCLLS